MAYFDLSVDREIDFMLAYGLTADELFVIKLIFYAQDGHDEYIKRYFNECHLTLDLVDILQSLQDKGIILKSYKIPAKNAVFNPVDVEFGQLFKKNFNMHSWDMGMDIFNMYPTFLGSDGNRYSAKNIAKHFKSMDDFCFAYGKSIKFNPEVHQKVLDILQWAIENNEISYGICEFVISMKWRELEQIKEAKEDTEESFGDYNPFKVI